MRTNYEFTLREGYLLNKKNGKLEEYKPIEITFDTASESVVYRGMFWSGERVIREEDFELYQSVDDYEHGNKVKSYTEWSIKDIFRPFCDVTYDENHIYAWTFSNGCAKMENIRGCSVRYQLKNGYIQFDNAFLDEEMTIYSSREDAVNMNDVVVIDKDGNEQTRVGFHKALRLSDEQKSAIEKFKESWKMLKDLKVDIVFNENTYEVFFSNEINDVETSRYCENGFTQIDRYLEKTGLYVSNSFYDEGLWMKHTN